jgi:hypothetical protein
MDSALCKSEAELRESCFAGFWRIGRQKYMIELQDHLLFPLMSHSSKVKRCVTLDS